MAKAKLVCSRCGREPVSCDSGYGHSFARGASIFCKQFPKRKGPYGGAKSLHYCNESEMDEMILDTARGEAEFGFELRSYGKPAKIIAK